MEPSGLCKVQEATGFTAETQGSPDKHPLQGQCCAFKVLKCFHCCFPGTWQGAWHLVGA